jgi:hypothetical protein
MRYPNDLDSAYLMDVRTEDPPLLKAAEELNTLITALHPLLLSIPQEELEKPPAHGKWSKKEILGHLIDSAANNHQRFVRIQYQDLPHIVYHQEEWVSLQDYRSEPLETVIALWAAYNRHLAHVITKISPINYNRKGNTGKDAPFEPTLEWLVEDYLAHMKHHLEQIIPSYSRNKD